MQFTDTQIDTMLSATGTTAIIDDGSVSGLSIYCKFRRPQRVLDQFSGALEMTEPQAKVRYSAISEFIERGLLFVVNNTDYTIKTFEPLDNGMCILMLEDT